MSTRLRLLVLTSTYPRWAGDHEPGFVHELARRLIDGFEVTVVCPHAPGAARREMLDGVSIVRYRYAPTLLEVLVKNGGIIPNLRRRRWLALLVPGFLIAQAWAVWRVSRALQPAVIHAHWLIPQGLIAACLSALGMRLPPFVVTSHGADLFSLRSAPMLVLKRLVLRRAAAVTIVSEGMRETVTRGGGDPDRVSVEPMGVDLTKRFTPDETTRRSVDEILFVGRLVEKKGLRILLDALPAILEQRPSASLTVVGFGPELEALQRQASSLGVAANVRFLGAVPQAELPAHFRRAAVFVAPFVQAADGDQEGLGLVTIEALGCGCPAVISRLPATEHLLKLPTVQGVPSGDRRALAETVLATLTAPPGMAEREASRTACLETMDWHCVATRYASLLKRIVKADDPRSHAADVANEPE